MKTEYLKINNIPSKLYSADHPHGTVLAVHGFGGSKESAAISALAETITPQGLNVLSWDLPAHGERTETAEALSIDRCISEIISIEWYIEENIGGSMYAFATSFGGLCMLHRISESGDPYHRIVLRVPAVNMSRTLITISKMQDPEFTMEKAEESGFFIRMSRNYAIPYRFYDELCSLSCLHARPEWNNNRIMTIYAGQDELVAPEDTEIFLKLNPNIASLLIKDSDHRMARSPEFLSQALDAASAFFSTT
ncbi:MAG: alpha/beta hydrolase [Oscillospiraceae bacterium]|nr:alpha/beta hydrolase [Oscillospiraceae bacterium]